MQGSIDDALAVLKALSCSIPEDPHVQLNIRIHKLFELLHMAGNTPKDKSLRYTQSLTAALAYSQELATFALDAFPEAYELFTESMMLFAFPEQTSTTDFIMKKRKHLADDLVALARVTVRARESCLSFLLRYLILIYIQFKPPSVTDEQRSPINILICDLVMFKIESNEGPLRVTWKTDGLRPPWYGQRAEFKESDVQALRERVDMSRQEAIEGLCFTGGNFATALKNELGRIKMDPHRFRRMVLDYCAARGLSACYPASPILDSPILLQPKSDIFYQNGFSEAELSSVSIEMFTVMHKLRSLSSNGNCDNMLEKLRQIDEFMPERSPVLDFRIGQNEFLYHVRHKDLSSAIDVLHAKLGVLSQTCPEFLPLLTETLTFVIFKDDLEAMKNDNQRPQMGVAKEEGTRESDGGNEPTEELSDVGQVLQGDIHDSPATSGGMTSEDTDMIAITFTDFLTKVSEKASEWSSVEHITQEAYNILERRNGEPELVQLLKLLIKTHEEWQASNMMTDRFSDTFGIGEICGEVNTRQSILDEIPKKDRTEGEQNVAQKGIMPIEQRPDSLLASEQRENTILTLMEFLAMSRAEALSVVRNHPQASNTEAILDSLLGSMM